MTVFFYFILVHVLVLVLVLHSAAATHHRSLFFIVCLSVCRLPVCLCPFFFFLCPLSVANERRVEGATFLLVSWQQFLFSCTVVPWHPPFCNFRTLCLLLTIRGATGCCCQRTTFFLLAVVVRYLSSLCPSVDFSSSSLFFSFLFFSSSFCFVSTPLLRPPLLHSFLLPPSFLLHSITLYIHFPLHTAFPSSSPLHPTLNFPPSKLSTIRFNGEDPPTR